MKDLIEMGLIFLSLVMICAYAFDDPEARELLMSVWRVVLGGVSEIGKAWHEGYTH